MTIILRRQLPFGGAARYCVLAGLSAAHLGNIDGIARHGRQATAAANSATHAATTDARYVLVASRTNAVTRPDFPSSCDSIEPWKSDGSK